jgi:hypothetical protein
MAKISTFSPEIWIIISKYFDNLASFLKVWIVLKLFKQEIQNTHKTFWKNLLLEFFVSRNLLIEDAQRVFHLISYYKDPEEQSDCGPDDYFLFLRVLFQKSKCNRSGCFQNYYEWSNVRFVCCFHPGKMKNSRSLTCCRATSFQSSGCSLARHDGNFYFMTFIRRSREHNEKNSKNEIKTKNQKEKEKQNQTSGFLPVISPRPNPSITTTLPSVTLIANNNNKDSNNNTVADQQNNLDSSSVTANSRLPIFPAIK